MGEDEVRRNLFVASNLNISKHINGIYEVKLNEGLYGDVFLKNQKLKRKEKNGKKTQGDNVGWRVTAKLTSNTMYTTHVISNIYAILVPLDDITLDFGRKIYPSSYEDLE